MQQQLPGERLAEDVAPAQQAAPSGPTLVVKQFRFDGNSLLSSEQLAPAVEPYLNRPLDLNGLQLAAAAVGEVYRAAGWLARVYVPQQEVTSGVVNLQVVEARFGKIRQEGAIKRYDPLMVSRYIEAVQETGQLLNTRAVDRALLLIDDLPGVVAAGNLAPGEGQAETDLLLTLEDEPLFIGEFGLDNQGSRSTGPERLTLDAYLSSPLKLGDQLRTSLIYTQGSEYLWLNYSLPAGYSGLRIGANASALNYDVITPEFQALDLTGNFRTWGLDANYPLLRERSRNLYLGLAYDKKTFNDRQAGVRTSHYENDNLRLSLTGNLFDRLGGGGANFLSLSFTGGDVQLGSLEVNENANLEGRFSKLNYMFSRQQAITSALSLYAGISGQLADTNLISAEKFYLGGPYGVRAYPANEGGGDEGTLAKLELRYRARPNLVLTGFYDWGSIRQNKDNSTGITPNTYELDGAGISLSWTGPKGLSLEATYAHRLNDNPNPTATGKDQDGSLRKDRLWLSASLPF
jgi:hemolysin activation/secretion protein